MGALGKARGLLGKGDYAGAAAALEECEGLRERALLAQARAGQKDFAEALRLFEDVRDQEGTRKSVLTPEQWNAMGQAAERTGQPREALAAYERVLEGRLPKSLSPDLLHLRAGTCSKEVGDWAGAVEHFRKVRNPLFVSMSQGDIMCELDECYRNLGESDRAEECMDSALEEHPVRPRNVLTLAWHMYHRTKSANGPMLLLRKLLERDEGNAAAWLILGKIWLADGHLDKAEDALEQSREIDPEKVALWETFSTLYSQRGESERALSALQQAAQLDQASGGAAALLAQMFENSGQAGEAMRMYEQMDPNDPKVLLRKNKILYKYAVKLQTAFRGWKARQQVHSRTARTTCRHYGRFRGPLRRREEGKREKGEAPQSGVFAPGVFASPA